MEGSHTKEATILIPERKKKGFLYKVYLTLCKTQTLGFTVLKNQALFTLSIAAWGEGEKKNQNLHISIISHFHFMFNGASSKNKTKQSN